LSIMPLVMLPFHSVAKVHLGTQSWPWIWLTVSVRLFGDRSCVLDDYSISVDVLIPP
jgi:hypothetical protein